jgi:CHAT domain-containing protein
VGDGSELSLAEIEAMPRLFSGVDLLTLSACSTGSAVPPTKETVTK